MWGAVSRDWRVGSPTVPSPRAVLANEIDGRRCSAERPAGVLRAGPSSG